MKMDWLPNFELTEGGLYRFFLEQAYTHAWHNAIDKSTKNGAVIVDSENNILSWGANGLPDYLADDQKFHEAPLKYDAVKHAERDAIFSALEEGIKLEGMTMYCTWYACEPCANTIAAVGIKRVIGHYEMTMRTRDYWKEEVALGFRILHKAGVETLLYTGRIGGVESLMNGEIWHP